MIARQAIWFGLLVIVLGGCTRADSDHPGEPTHIRRETTSASRVQESTACEDPGKLGVQWAIAIHGGAGKPPQGLPAEKLAACKQEVSATLTRALTLGRDMVADGRTALDVVESVARILDDDPNSRRCGRWQFISSPLPSPR